MNKRTPVSYNDNYFSADVDFIVHNILGEATRFGVPAFLVEWLQPSGPAGKCEDTWEPLENIKDCPRLLIENFRSKKRQDAEETGQLEISFNE